MFFAKLLKELDMYRTLKSQIEQGMPVLATCAGMKNRYGNTSIFVISMEIV